MSTKRNVPTFRIFCATQTVPIEGPVVSPDRRRLAQNFSELHQILRQDEAILVYSKEWQYIRAHVIHRVLRGKERFSLPWPLTDEHDSSA